MPLRALASVNLAAIERNVGELRSRLGSATQLCAVVKADAYGHGAVRVARASLAGGASGLAVAAAGEAAELRAGGIPASILVMGAVSTEELPDALASGAELVAWSSDFVEAVRRSKESADLPIRMHVKFDTGMGRLGTRRLDEAVAVAEQIAAAGPVLELAGAMTHFATADEDPEFLRAQLDAFEPFVTRLRALAPGILVHSANSAALLCEAQTHYDMVRPGIALYGGDPMNRDPTQHGLEPALSLTSYLAAVKPARRGDSAGYGRRFIAERDTWIATLPIGYADGIMRCLTNNCEVIVGGRRYPLVGTVSMDNITIDLGPGPEVAVGARATIIGQDGPERQTAEQLAARAGTINYEILCGISARVPRVYHRDGVPT